MEIKDFGGKVHVMNVKDIAKENETFRTAIWTGTKLQMTVMTIAAGVEMGIEVHNTEDQIYRIEKGEGRFESGATKENLDNSVNFEKGDSIFVPAGEWHNIINTGAKAIKMSSVYGPAHHAFGTVHATAADDVH